MGFGVNISSLKEKHCISGGRENKTLNKFVHFRFTVFLMTDFDFLFSL